MTELDLSRIKNSKPLSGLSNLSILTSGILATAFAWCAPETSPQQAVNSKSAPRDSFQNFSANLDLDARLFFQSPQFSGQDDHNFSTAMEAEYYRDWDDNRSRFAIKPFLRWDANDDERTHADLREFYWRTEVDQLTVKFGMDVIFWGVAESQHLVDIINQTDWVENIDGEDKLGQPMLNMDYSSDIGRWQLYILPYFRERTFPGREGRLRVHPVVDTDDPIYESGSKERHVDVALRWSQFVGDWDIGLAHFSGTSREPLLLLQTPGSGQTPVRPFYHQIDQTSLDLQATKGAWLWKLEAVYNHNNLNSYHAYVAGFENTWYGIANSPIDLGWLLEYHNDQRDELSTTGLQNDLYLGLRLTGNDIASTQLLVGSIVDLDDDAVFFNLEASRRLSEFWTFNIEARIFGNIPAENPLRFYAADDYLEIRLTRYF